ncbi:putative membrane protein [Pedobacter sp. UYEF25]
MKKTKDTLEPKTWHETHRHSSTFGQKIADSVAQGMGSWRFIIIQTIFVVVWMVLNVVAFVHHWDVYPYILLNLLFSTQAAYAAPIIMMAQNRQSQRDRAQADNDYRTNVAAKKEIEHLVKRLDAIEIEKLDRIISLLEGENKQAKDVK